MPFDANERPPVTVVVETVYGNLCKEPTAATVVGRFREPSPTGVTRDFDKELGGRISRALENGSISSTLGHLFPVPVPAGTTLPHDLRLVMLVGMGTPESFGRDEVRMMVTNATAALVDLGYDTFGTILIGSGGGRVSTDQAVAALIEGVADGLKRAPLQTPPRSVFTIKVVSHHEDRLKQYLTCFTSLRDGKREGRIRDGIVLKVNDVTRTQSGFNPHAKSSSPPDPTVDPLLPRTVRVSVLRPDPSPGRPASAFTRLQYSALGAGAVLPVREVEVQTYFTERLPGLFSRNATDRDPYVRAGRLLSRYLLPDDIRVLMAGGEGVTLEVDRRTAAIPWEMAVLDGDPAGRNRPVRFLGLEPGLCRQFRTLSEGGRATTPPLNHSLRALVIADPAGDLPGARVEGLCVAEALYDARGQKDLDIRVTVRIGPIGGNGEHLLAARALAHVAGPANDGDPVLDAGPCDPMEILGLIAETEYDVIHFAGHGVLLDDRCGWKLGHGCVLSATELIRSRRAPRLVFANACHSGDLGPDRRERPPDDRASLAEGFFSRGVHNYIGTAWPVADEPARKLAVAFYQNLLRSDGAPPGVIGAALQKARSHVKTQHPFDFSWGAYQHYGQWNDKLVALPNWESSSHPA